ncbi:hypothetical protein [Microvirga aerophila]|uniref:Uncharacterized protein n=1 Tax=Microvirga aerophila TaxID=670291 RepID=A0A512C1J7_9HYPH|nr:hypothetical protein [Microvirga aerophila]GEO18081.1 hypothetical protein MAE02_57770 [Microvirga aerophila]
MLAVQSRLPLGMPFRPRTRNVRRPFTPSFTGQPYRLPHDVRDRLAASLVPFRNREAAFALAVFLARFWSVPGRVVDSFHIDRRALADHGELHLTEAKVRGAIRVLEEVAFLDRAIPSSGSKYKATEEGLHRKPIRFVFGSEYAPLFIAANERAARARGGRSSDRRPMTPSSSQRPPTTSSEAQKIKSPKSKSVADPMVYLGDLRNGKKIGLPPNPFVPDPKLEAALENLLKGIRQSRGG